MFLASLVGLRTCSRHRSVPSHSRPVYRPYVIARTLSNVAVCPPVRLSVCLSHATASLVGSITCNRRRIDPSHSRPIQTDTCVAFCVSAEWRSESGSINATTCDVLLLVIHHLVVVGDIILPTLTDSHRQLSNSQL